MDLTNEFLYSSGYNYCIKCYNSITIFNQLFMKRLKSRVAVREMTATQICEALEDSSGNKEETAYALDISTKTLERLMAKFQIKLRDYKMY